MKLCTISIITEERFSVSKDGQIYSPSGYGDSFWGRYLSIFSQLIIIARICPVDEVKFSWVRITDPRIKIHNVGSFIGPWKFLRNFPSIFHSFNKACNDADGILVRAPGTLSLLFAILLLLRLIDQKPLAIELVGDPVGVFDAGVGGFFSVFFKFLFKFSTKKICADANLVSYVTQNFLQIAYPANSAARTFSYSSVEISDEILSNYSRPPTLCRVRNPVAFTSASLEVPYKGIDVLILAAAELKKVDFPLTIRIAGEGRLKSQLESMTVRLGVTDRILFLGRLDRNSVISEMRSADIYLQPSLTEGLPRAVIEACATAAPIIASRVGGIPELLHENDMVTPGDFHGLAECIEKVVNDPVRLAAMSERNLATALKFDSKLLEGRRRNFYSALHNLMIAC